MNDYYKNDEKELVPGHQKIQELAHPLLVYNVFKLIPFVGFFLIYYFRLNIPNTICIMGFTLMAEFYVILKIIGNQIIGISWFFQNGKIQFFSRSDSFIPQSTYSNIFWFGLFVSVIIWIILIFVFIYLKHYFFVNLSLVVLLFEVLNLILYLKAYLTSKKQRQEEIIQYLEAEEICFPYVHDDENEEQ